jgi:integrase
VVLNPGETKNAEGRTLYLDDELRRVLNVQWAKRRKSATLLPYVFLNRLGTDKVKQFRKSWATACRAAKLGDRLFHDFRRTAIRNMVRAGVSEHIAMKVSGHKTRSVFERYDIVSEADLKVAAERQAAYLKSKANESRHTLDTLTTFPAKSRNA